MKPLGRHLLVELVRCDKKVLTDARAIEKILKSGAKAAKARILHSFFHRFRSHGVSGVVVIAESHLAVHTWPEHRFAALDVFTCGRTSDPWKAGRLIALRFGAGKTRVREIRRGVFRRRAA